MGLFPGFLFILFPVFQSDMRQFPFWGLLWFVSSAAGLLRAEEPPTSITVGTWNLEWFYDDDPGDNLSKLSKEKSAPDREAWEWKLNSVADVVGRHKPYIMAFQEVENRKVIFDLKNRLRSQYGISYRIGFVEGFDTFTEQDVAVIFQDGLVEMSRKEQNARQWQSKKFKNLSKHLITRFEIGSGANQRRLTLFNMHLRAMPERESLRIQQVLLAREWINEEIRQQGNVVVLGDFNTEHFFGTEKADSDIGTLRGLADQDASNDLLDAHQWIPEKQRGTHMTGKQFDRILFSRSMQPTSQLAHGFVFDSAFVERESIVKGAVDLGDARWKNLYSIPQGERDISDHYPVFAKFLVK